MTTIFISRLLGLLVFAALGYFLSKKIAPPRNSLVWVLCLAGVIAAGFIGVSAMLISVPGFTLYFNNALQGLGLGLVVGWLAQNATRQTSQVT